MSDNGSVESFTEEDYLEFTRSIPYLLAGLEGNTNGYRLTSIAVQQAGFRSFRVILRGRKRDPDGRTICVVSFTSANDPASCLLHAEVGYREDLIRWHTDKFATSIEPDNSKKDERRKLDIAS